MNQRGIGFHRIPESEAGVLPQPTLEFNFEAESLAQVLFEEGAQVLGTDDIGGDGLVQGNGHLAVDRASFRLRLGLHQLRKCRPDQILQIVPVIHVRDVEMVPGAGVGPLEHDFVQDRLAGIRHLDIQVVVADQAEQDTVAVNAIVPHHLFDGNLPGAGTLVNDELNEI